MKILLVMLVSAIAAAAQSQLAQCGTPSGAAGDSAPNGRSSSVAAKADRRGAAVGNIAAQIQPRRADPTRPFLTCTCGTVAASALTAQTRSQEVPILTGVAGRFRFDHVMVQETARFVSDKVDSLVVGVGRAGFGADVVSRFPLKSESAPSSFWYARPSPPQFTGSYDLVLIFKASGPLGDGTASNFDSGTVAWEVCGYNGAPASGR